MWPQKESQSQEQSQKGRLRSLAHKDCPFYHRVPCPTKGHLGGGQELLLRRGGALAASSLGPQLLGVCVCVCMCVWILGPVVQDSQCHQEQGHKNRPAAGSRAGDNCSCLSLNAQQRVLLLSYPSAQPASSQPTFWVPSRHSQPRLPCARGESGSLPLCFWFLHAAPRIPSH